jgi:ribosome-binding protein aMBF1 (putative translation factor)
MKKLPTDGVFIKVGSRKPRRFLLPKPKAKSLMTLISDYELKEENTIPWREAYQEEIEKYSEAGLMIRGSRSKEELTQKELAERLGTNQANVAAMESGQRAVGKSMAKRLAKIFKVDYRVFLTGK